MQRSFVRFVVSLVLAAGVCSFQAVAEEVSETRTDSKLSQQFTSTVAPFLVDNCMDCHGAEDPEAALDLSGFKTPQDVIRQFGVWDLVLQRVDEGDMPPKDSGYEPTVADRSAVVGWIERLRDDYAHRHAGDPGDVLAHRLSAAEYNNTIRDLTGVDIRPADQFPVDPTNEAGFDNSGESLAMTPSLLDKYLQAARAVADHLVFLPDRLDFAPHPVVTETDRDKYCVRRIVDFYETQNTDVSDYLYAIWEIKHQGAHSPINGLSEKYLETLRRIFVSSEPLAEPLNRFRKTFDQIPDNAATARDACRQLANSIAKEREKYVFKFPHLSVRGINQGSQPFVLWRNRQKASHRMKMNREAFDEVFPDQPGEELVAGYERFCRTFPDAFYVDRRGREYVDRKQDELKRESEYRLLSAGFHSMMGYFRDDDPLRELMLTDDQQRHLDKLWFGLEFVAQARHRQHSGFIWFERAEGRFLVDPEFDEFRSADKNATSDVMIRNLSKVYLAKAIRLGADEVEQQAIEDHFSWINAAIQKVDAAQESATQAHLGSVLELARLAYRRSLSKSEQDETIAFYQQMVSEEGLDHQEAVRNVLVSILLSPHFCFRMHESDTKKAIERLDDFALASRLSYFIWSSMPDSELLSLAEQGKLRDPAVYGQQITRMLADARSRGLAEEFGGNWLGFRHFLSHNSVDRNRFPQFDDTLRRSMFEEPVHFFANIIRNNESVLDLLYGEHTFVDATLARHYEIDFPSDVDELQWVRIENANRYGRGGILPMAVFMTKNSPGLRTSPVKRGFWVVRQLLGTHIPAPPPNVPDLPEDESQLGELTLRQVLEKHRDHVSCAGCHQKFDSFGLAFEGYGPIGELRKHDLAGNSIQISADFPDGSVRQGLSGLKSYLREHRQDDFDETLCRKLLVFALGRSLILSDEPLIEKMKKTLSENDHRFHALIHTIADSQQFTHQRGQSFRLTD